MNILSMYPLPGIAYTHDAAACIVTDDGVVYAADEERFLRGQHAIGHLAERAAMMGFRHARLLPRDVNLLVTTSMERCRRHPDFHARASFLRELSCLVPTVPVLCVPHHLAHSALAVLTSPFDDCVFLTLDAGGDGAMGHWGIYSKGRFRILERLQLSPAIFFSFITTLCGFALFEEGKAMGLAPYGRVDSRLRDWCLRWFSMQPDSAAMSTPLQVQWAHTLDVARISPDAFQRHKYSRWHLGFDGAGDLSWIDEIPPEDIARTGQEVFQDFVSNAVDVVVRRTGVRSVACAGGAFLNVAAMGHLHERHPNVGFHVPVAPHDAGLALGAALWTRHIHGRPRVDGPLSPYLGPDFDPREVEDALRAFAADYSRPVDLAAEVAAALANGMIVGWFDGRAEYGARALGARSVLADPRRSESKARLNQLLKKRDWFMPFAPSILAEYVHDYFPDFRPSSYMNVTYRVRPERRSAIPAAVHVDGTCRVHAVSQPMQASYHRLLCRFHEVSGVPVLLNTSFNRHGLPMVATPRQAVEHLLEGSVDLLAIGGFVVRGQPRAQIGRLQEEAQLLPLMSLRRAAQLARDNRLESAERLLSRVDLRLRVGARGFERDGRLVWDIGSSLEELDRWWASIADN